MLQWVNVMERRFQQMILNRRKWAQSLQNMGPTTVVMGASTEAMMVEYHHWDIKLLSIVYNHPNIHQLALYLTMETHLQAHLVGCSGAHFHHLHQLNTSSHLWWKDMAWSPRKGQYLKHLKQKNLSTSFLDTLKTSHPNMSLDMKLAEAILDIHVMQRFGKESSRANQLLSRSFPKPRCLSLDPIPSSKFTWLASSVRV